MKILFWVPYPSQGPSNRYRVEQYLPYLEKSGIQCHLRPFWSSNAFKILYKKGLYIEKFYYFLLGTLKRIIDLVSIFRYDGVFIHREAYPIGGIFFEKMLQLFDKPFIYDFDDAIFLPTSTPWNNFIEKFKTPGKIQEIIKLSHHCIAGNRYLADFALKYTNSVSIIPTSIDTEKYSNPKPKKIREAIVIGWTGSLTTSDYLNSLNEVFVKLSQRFPKIKFKIIGGNFTIPGLSNIINEPWQEGREMDEVKTFDIGIMPLPDNEWAKGKCAFKAILYMSLSIPCVCSAVGMNKEVITDGINGFLAGSQTEWLEKLTLLINNPELGKRVGVAGRKTVEEEYSVKVNAPKIIKMIEGLSNRAKRAKRVKRVKRVKN